MARCEGKPILLLIGQAGAPTGFARVLDALATRLALGFQVHLLNTLQASGHCGNAETSPYTLHPNSGEESHPEALLAFCQRLRPDVCLTLDELRGCASRIVTLQKLSPRPRVLCYCAGDEPDQFSADLLPYLAAADCLITFTQQALTYLHEALQAVQIAPPSLAVIPHGVDTRVFQPEPRAEARQQFFGAGVLPDDAFIILNASRNQPFKRVDLTMKGFALFAREKPPSVKLYLHMGSRPQVAGQTSLADHLGIRDRLLTPSTYSAEHPHLPDAQLNLLYNCCDVGINTSDREGWGLVSFEHAATGAPQIVPGLATLRELWSDAALILPTEVRPSAMLLGRIAPSARAEDVAEALELFYNDPEARAYWGAAALTRARNPAYQWDQIAEQWASLIWAILERGADDVPPAATLLKNNIL